MKLNKALQKLHEGITSLTVNDLTFFEIETLLKTLETNTRLKALRIMGSDDSVFPMSALVKLLDKNKSLNTVYIRNYVLNATDAPALAQALENNNTLIEIGLSSNRLGNTGAQTIARAIEKNTTLRTVELVFNKIGYVGVQAIAQVLEKNANLTRINLAGNTIDDTSAKVLAEAIEKSKRLKSMDLSDTSMTKNGAQLLASSLEKNTTLFELKLNSVRSGADDFIDALARAPKTSKGVKILHLRNCSINSADKIAALLENDQKITIIDLGNNILGGAVQAIAQALETNHTLISMNLFHNLMDTPSVAAIARMLKKNRTLEDLDLSYNPSGFDTVTSRRFVEALGENATLRSVNLASNRLGVVKFVLLCQALKNNQSLKRIDLYQNRLTDACAPALLTWLTGNKTVTTLNLGGNQLTDVSAYTLTTILANNSTLEVLGLTGTQIGVNGIKAIVDALEKNRTLTTLDLTDTCKLPEELDSRLQALLKRNQIDKKLKAMDLSLQGCIAWQTLNPQQRISQGDPSKRPYFKLTELADEFLDIWGDVLSLKALKPRSWLSRWWQVNPLDIADIEDEVQSSYLAQMALFHLRCIEDRSHSVADLDFQVASAEDCLAQMVIGSDTYRITCFHIGQYYFQRATIIAKTDSDSALLYAKTALNFLSACGTLEGYQEIDDLCHILASMVNQTQLVLVANQVVVHGRHYTIKVPSNDPMATNQIEQARLTPVFGERKPPIMRKSLNPKRIQDNLQQTVNRGALFSFNRLLDGLPKVVIHAQRTFKQQIQRAKKGRNVHYFFSQMTPEKFELNRSAYQPQKIKQALQGIAMLKQIANGGSIPNNLQTNIDALKNTPAAYYLNTFMKKGYAAPILGHGVNSLDDILKQLLKKEPSFSFGGADADWDDMPFPLNLVYSSFVKGMG